MGASLIIKDKIKYFCALAYSFFCSLKNIETLHYNKKMRFYREWQIIKLTYGNSV